MHPQQRPVWLLALSLGLAPGCFQPLDPYEPQAEEEPQPTPGPHTQDATAPVQLVLDGSTPPLPGPGAVPRPMDAGVGSVSPSTAVPPLPTAPPIVVPVLPPGLIDAGAPDRCQNLPPLRCEQTQGCSTARFYAFDDDRNCSTSELRTACTAFPCGLFGSTLARAPGGQVYWTPIGCMPADFTPISRPAPEPGPPCPSPAAVTMCARHRDERSCASDPNYHCLPNFATAYDPDERCVGSGKLPSGFLSCMAWQTASADPSGYYRDWQGRVWRVPADALDAVPPDWKPVAPSSVLPDAGAELPTCFKTLD